MISRGYIKRVGSNAVDVLLVGSAATITNVPISGQIDASTLAVGMTVLVDTIDGRPVVLHTVAGTQRAPGQPVGTATMTNNALLADGSVPLTGDLTVAPGVTVDGYDISTLGQAIDNLQAADTIARTGYTVLSHASHLVQTIAADDTELLIRHGIFVDQEMLSLSNTEGQIEVMQVVGNPVATVDNRGALCYRYTVTRRVNTNPGALFIGWAAATLINGLTHKGYIAFDSRDSSAAAPSMRVVLHTDIDAGTTEQIMRAGSLNNILGLGAADYGFATGRLTTGDRYFAYNYNRNLLALRGADIEVSDPTGVPVFRVWGVAEGGYEAGNARLGKSSGGHLETIEDRIDFYTGSYRVMTISPQGARFRGMIWSGDQPGPGVGIGEDEGQGLIAARNPAGVGQFVVRTGDTNVHVHIGNTVELGGYAQFADGNFTTDGIIRARAFELLGGGTIGSGVVLTNAGKFTAGAGNNVAVIDGEDATWRVYAGHATPGSAPFRVSQTGEVWLTNAHVTGEVTASAGVIGGWTIASGYLTAINVGLAPSDYPFYAGSTYANRATAPFRVTTAGAVSATSGSIGGWTLGVSTIVGGSGTATLHSSGYLSMGVSNDIVRLDSTNATHRLWIGNALSALAPFNVTKTGVLTASGANITGTINATAGDFTGSVYVGAASPRIHLDGVNKRIEATTFVSGTSGFRIDGATGNAEFNNITARGAITSVVFHYQQVQASAGDLLLAKGANRLATQLTLGVTPRLVYVEDPPGIDHAVAGTLWAIDDIIRIKNPAVGDVWLKVTAVTDSAPNPGWLVTASYQSGTSSGIMPVGTAIVNYGQSGQGIIRLSATDAAGPYTSIATHAGSPWTTITERARLGNLDGIAGASGYGLWTDNGFFTGTVNASAGVIAGWNITPTKLYSEDVGAFAGVGMATYQDAGTWAFWAGSHTPASAEFRVSKYGEMYATSATITGTVTANTLTANSAGSIAGWTISSGHLYSGTGSNRAGMQPATYPFYAGSETPAAAPFRVTPAGALTASNVSISAGGGNVSLDASGLRMNYAATSTAYLSWYSSSTLKAYLGSFLDGSTNVLRANVQSSGRFEVTGAADVVLAGTTQVGNFRNSGGLLFFASTGSVASKQTVTGSRGGNAALASLLTALATYGLITDSTTA